MKQWWEEIIKQRLVINDYMHNMMLKMFNKVNLRKLRLKWKDQSCLAEDVCIFILYIFCKNKKSFNKERIAISTYHTVISKDKINLKVRKCKTKNKLTAALQDQWFSDATSFELMNNQHKKLFFQHSASVEIRKICFTLNALMNLWS